VTVAEAEAAIVEWCRNRATTAGHHNLEHARAEMPRWPEGARLIHDLIEARQAAGIQPREVSFPRDYVNND
jgi:hypothetical protein